MLGDNIQSEWASQFPSHPIFKTGEAQQNGGRLTVDDLSTNHASHPRRTSRMCFRGSDIVLAVGKELRLAPFVDYRSSLGGSAGEGQYKVAELALLCDAEKMMESFWISRYIPRISSLISNKFPCALAER